MKTLLKIPKLHWKIGKKCLTSPSADMVRLYVNVEVSSTILSYKSGGGAAGQSKAEVQIKNSS